MKRGALHFLGRKNKSLFDTGVKIQEMDNVELVLDSSAIPESGTAKVRSRPTVKHYMSSSDSMYAFAVPTPKVPDLPPPGGPETNGSVDGDHLSDGSTISVPDPVEGEIIVPPPPSMAPPPPPSQYFLPPPDFMGDLDGAAMPAGQPPPVPPPKPPSLAMEEDLTLLKPPPMAPPKPPSTCSSASTVVSISSPPPTKILDVSDPPKFAPPMPPPEKQHRTPRQKAPPPKPIRLSSVPIMDILPRDIPPSPSARRPTPSSFNPQNAAKLYNAPKTSLLGGHADRDTRPKQIVLFLDSGAGGSSPVPVQSDGKAPSTAPPSKPVCRNSNGTQLDKDVRELRENFRVKCPSNTPQLRPKPEAKDETDSIPRKHNVCPSLPLISPRLQKGPDAHVFPERDPVTHEESPNQHRRFSPLIESKLRNLKGAEASGTREAAAASPFALLMAAKEREKQRSTLSRQNSEKGNEGGSASIHHSDSSPNSFVVTPRYTSRSSLTSKGGPGGSPKSVGSLEPTPPAAVQNPRQPGASASASAAPALGGRSTATSQSPSSLKGAVERDPLRPECAWNETDGQEGPMPLLPPPPEFANIDLDPMSPPSFPPPDPPANKAPLAKVSRGPSPPPKPKPPAAPLLPPPVIADPKPPLETKPKAPFAQPPSPLSAQKATLLSILQKRMVEMDHKIVPKQETESDACDDWGSSVCDKGAKIPVVPRSTPQGKSYISPSKTTTLDLTELESQLKANNNLAPKSTTSNGAPSQQQYGMTFTVRPGSKTPITLVSKGDSS